MPWDDPDGSTRADYVAMVERVDRGVGEMLRALDRLDLASNTIVIFTNDNGGEWLSSNGPLFNRKCDACGRAASACPALVRWPGRIRPGTVSRAGRASPWTSPSSILAATGAAVPADARLDGMDLFPMLEGQAPVVERTLFWRTSAGNRQQKAVRQRRLEAGARRQPHAAVRYPDGPR